MTYEVFTADTFAGRFRIAVKVHKDALPGETRSEAGEAMRTSFGRGSRLLEASTTLRRLPAGFDDIASAKGWGFLARAACPLP